jgi:hypothetical protein
MLGGGADNPNVPSYITGADSLTIAFRIAYRSMFRLQPYVDLTLYIQTLSLSQCGSFLHINFRGERYPGAPCRGLTIMVALGLFSM